MPGRTPTDPASSPAYSPQSETPYPAVSFDTLAEWSGEIHEFLDDSPDVHKFGFQAARSRTGGVKAVGTAEDTGTTLYGAQARAALARQSGSSKRQTAPRNVSYDVTDEDGNVTPKKATNVSPERARAMAIASKLAALDPTGERPTDVKVRKARGLTAKLSALAQQAAAGDPKAATELQAQGKLAVEHAAEKIATVAPPPPEVRQEWEKQSRPAGGKGPMTDLADSVDNFVFGLFGSEPQGIMGKVGHLVNWLIKQPFKVAAFAVKHLFNFAKWSLGKLAGLGVSAAGAGLRAVGAGLKYAGGEIWDAAKPFLWWGASVAAGLGIMVAPIVAANMGLIPYAIAGLSLPASLVGGWIAGKRIGQKAIDAGLVLTGNTAILRNSEVQKFSEDEFALAGRDGQRATQLLGVAKSRGVSLLAELAARAVKRMLDSGDPLGAPVLFDDGELAQLRNSFAGTIATADLLGRARVRRMAEHAEKRAGNTFADMDPDPFDVFAEPIPAQAPTEAIKYFGKLVPALGTNPARYGPLLDRHAFTLAVATDQTVLQRVKDAIAKRLAGEGQGTPEIQEILDEAGVSPKNPQYSELVWRTNAMDSLNAGAMAELQHPEMQEMFPAYRYDGILDSRTGDDHRPKIGKYFPSTAAFSEVRGQRVWNCRCSFTPLSKYELADLKKRGTRIEETW